MVEKSAMCFFKPEKLSEIEATDKLSISIEGYPSEVFKYIDFEDVCKEKYFITSYGRVFTSYGKELFPESYIPPKQNTIYLRIELSCDTYIKRRKFFVHRLVANAFISKSYDDIINNRDIVNHKFNKDGRCNFVWNLEWTNDSENTYHGLHFNENYDQSLFNQDIILDRRKYISYDQYGEENPKSRISEFQANLICYAYTVLKYSMKDCAIYAWLEGNKSDISLVSSIVHGYCWNTVSINYGIIPKEKRDNIKRATNLRPDKFKEYRSIRDKKRR